MKRILCYGDSNTHGANPNWSPDSDSPSSPCKRLSENDRWPKILQNLLGTDKYEIIEEGLCGRTTIYNDNAWPYCNGRSYITPCILSHLPLDLIIISLGTNDMKTIFAPCADSASLAMSELIKTIKNPYLYEGFSIPKIMIVSPVEIGDNLESSFMYGTFNENSRLISKQLAKIYSLIAQKYICEFINAAEYAKPSDADSIHMDPENHAKLAKALYNKITEMEL